MTTSLQALAKRLTAEGNYAAALLTMQPGAALSDNIGAAELAILESWRPFALK